MPDTKFKDLSTIGLDEVAPRGPSILGNLYDAVSDQALHVVAHRLFRDVRLEGNLRLRYARPLLDEPNQPALELTE
jgi:hypothetical protein